MLPDMWTPLLQLALLQLFRGEFFFVSYLFLAPDDSWDTVRLHTSIAHFDISMDVADHRGFVRLLFNAY